MLVIPHKINETVQRFLYPSVNPRTPLGETLGNLDQIKVDKIQDICVVLSCDGLLEAQVLRRELLE